MDIILSVKGISKTYTAGQVKINALNQCDIEVRKGEFTAIVGKEWFRQVNSVKNSWNYRTSQTRERCT